MATLNVYFQSVPAKQAEKNLTLEPFQKDEAGKINFSINPILFNVVRGVYSREVSDALREKFPKLRILSGDAARKTLKFAVSIVEPCKALFNFTEIPVINISCCGFISSYLLKEYLEKEMPEGVEVIYHDFPETFFEIKEKRFPNSNHNNSEGAWFHKATKGVSNDKLEELQGKFKNARQ